LKTHSSQWTPPDSPARSRESSPDYDEPNSDYVPHQEKGAQPPSATGQYQQSAVSTPPQQGQQPASTAGKINNVLYGMEQGFKSGWRPSRYGPPSNQQYPNQQYPDQQFADQQYPSGTVVNNYYGGGSSRRSRRQKGGLIHGIIGGIRGAVEGPKNPAPVIQSGGKGDPYGRNAAAAAAAAVNPPAPPVTHVAGGGQVQGSVVHTGTENPVFHGPPAYEPSEAYTPPPPAKQKTKGGNTFLGM